MLHEMSPDKRWEAVQYLSELTSTYVIKAAKTSHYTSEAQYQELNRMASQLALLLPEHLFKELAFALSSPDETINIASFLINMRKYLLGDYAGDLKAFNLITHAPGAAFAQKIAEQNMYRGSGNAGS